MKKVIGIIAISAAFTGCANNTYWSKAGATDDSFARDRYQCMQQASYRQESITSITTQRGYTPYYNSNIVQDPSMFNACMASKGYKQV
jgi:hypothetical protein